MNFSFFMCSLFLVFMTLKLTSVIAWSWWFIAMPLYLPSVIGILIIAVVLLVAVYNDIAHGK
jgi:hypothetical protein